MKRSSIIVLSLIALNVLAVALVLIGTQVFGGPSVSEFADDIAGLIRRGELGEWITRDVLALRNLGVLATWFLFQYFAVRSLASMAREGRGFQITAHTESHRTHRI